MNVFRPATPFFLPSPFTDLRGKSMPTSPPQSGAGSQPALSGSSAPVLFRIPLISWRIARTDDQGLRSCLMVPQDWVHLGQDGQVSLVAVASAGSAIWVTPSGRHALSHVNFILQARSLLRHHRVHTLFCSTSSASSVTRLSSTEGGLVTYCLAPNGWLYLFPLKPSKITRTPYPFSSF